MKKLKKIQTNGYNYIGVFLTLGCPRGCSYCLNELSGGLEGRATVAGERWLEGLSRIETNIPLTFNGGEPLSHPNFFDIVNGLEESVKIDLLTTLPIDAQEFIRNLNPKRFERDLPYSAIRVTFHPETMDLDETIGKVKVIKSAGFDIMMNLVDRPSQEEETNSLRDRILENGLAVAVKPFLGYLDGRLYGQYKYQDACSEKFSKPVNCRTSILSIDPIGDIYRCYGDMFTRNPQGLLGNIFEAELDTPRKYRACTNFGHCHPCDVQTKLDRFGTWGYTVVDIVGKDVVTIKNSRMDWRLR